MEIKDLYRISHNIDEDDNNFIYKNKYTFLGHNKVIHCKYLDVNDTLTIETPINSYIQKFGTVLLFPNYINNEIVDLFIKPLDSKEMPLKLGKTGFPYGIGNLADDFKYGDTLFVVEGIGDYGALKLIEPSLNVVAIRTNGFENKVYDFFASITNNIVMIPDNDKAGMGQLGKTKVKLSSLGVNFAHFTQFTGFKDSGDIVDLIIRYKKGERHLLENINIAKEYYRAQISLFKN